MAVGRSLVTLKHNSALQERRTEKYLYSKSINSIFPCNCHSTGASYLSSFSGDKWTRRGAISRGATYCERQFYVARRCIWNEKTSC